MVWRSLRSSVSLEASVIVGNAEVLMREMWTQQ